MAAIPLTPIAVSFAFEAGYVTYFGIPLGLIDLSWTTILLAGATLFGYLGTIGLLAIMARAVSDRPLPYRFRILLLVVAPSLQLIALFRFHWDIAWIIPISLTVGLLTENVQAMFQRGGTYREKLAAVHASNERLWNPFQEVATRYGPGARYVIIILVLAVGFGWGFGRGAAFREVDFFLTDIGQGTGAVVRFYRDIAIVMPLDRRERTLGPQVLVVNATDLGASIKTPIGPLRPLE